MPRIRFTFGLDFGTSKTALCVAPTGTVTPPIVDLTTNARGDPIQTCLLRNKINGKIYIGRAAEQEYIRVQSDEQRQALEFHSNFKPHIHQSAEHREQALQFLTAVRRSDRIDTETRRKSGEAVVAAGCPVSWIKDGSAETLCALLTEAGFPPVFTVAEPVGAAFHFLAAHLKAADFHRDIVVFDWGAGTFDMTVLRAGRIDYEGSKTWGSTIYGGRLFDDLFYQWLLESAEKDGRAAELQKLAERPIDRAILLALRCRELKEDYSNHYSGDAGKGEWSALSSVEIGLKENKINLGDFIVPSAAEFENRMRSYRSSPEARRWIELSDAGIQPQEREFVEKLKAGEPVDLEAWGRRLIDTGLRELDVGEDATAILTGGSCNWKWFYDYVCSIPPFAGREHAVLRDSKPELTIARGLARAYAVGSYAKDLVAEVRSKRAQLIEPMGAMHNSLVKKLALELAALMRADDALQAELRGIFRDGLNRLAPVAAFKEHGTRLIDAIKRDRIADAVRPDLEKLIQRWLVEKRKTADRWAERFSLEAHELIMDLLKRLINPDIAALAEIATKACGATGQTTFEEALREVGRHVRFDAHMFARVFEALIDILPDSVRSVLGTMLGKFAPALGPSTVDNQVEAAVARFFFKMPDAIEANILAAQSPQSWAEGVVDHLIETLETLVRIARVDHAERLMMQMA